MMAPSPRPVHCRLSMRLLLAMVLVGACGPMDAGGLMMDTADPPCGTLQGCSTGYAAPPKGACRCAAGDIELGTDYMGGDIAPGENHGIQTVQGCCELCAATADCAWFQQGTGPVQDICWLKTKGGVKSGVPTQSQPRIGATVSPSYRSGASYCHVGLGAEFSAAVLGALLAYLVIGSAYGVRVLGKPRTLPAAHPHAERWREIQALVMDGVAFARQGGAARQGGSTSRPPSSTALSARLLIPVAGKHAAAGDGEAGGGGHISQRQHKSQRKKERKSGKDKKHEQGGEPQQHEPDDDGGANPTPSTGGRWVHIPG